jgi:glycosyltransferase involved in cell wall biosynthesis
VKIALLMNVFSPWAHSIAITLKRLGHAVHAIDFAESRSNAASAQEKFPQAVKELAAQIDGVHLIEGAPKSSLRYFWAPPKVRAILDQIGADVLACLYAGGYGQLAWASGFRPYAIYAMGSDILLLKNPFARVITRRVLRKASAIFANGEYLAQKTRDLAPGVSVKSLLIGVDPSEFQPGVPDAKTLFLSNRNFKEVYNNRYIIEAFALVRDVPDFEFHFASHGPLLDETKSFARRTLPSEIFERFKFWGGVTHEQMMDLLRRSRYFVSMSRSDGTATSLLEAMSCGLYPILSDIPQNRDWIDPRSRENGMLVPLDDPGKLATAFTFALQKPELSDRARAFNRGLIEERADSRQHGAKLASLLEKMREFHS